jgi:hypothetical protein
VRLPAPNYAKEGKSLVEFALLLPELRVQDLVAIDNLRVLLESCDSIELEVMAGESGQRMATLKLENKSPAVFPLHFKTDFIDRLAQIDQEIPAPYFCPQELELELTSSSVRPELSTRAGIDAELEHSRPEVTTFSLVIETEQGVPYREDFLRFCPGLSMASPKVESGGSHTQEEVDKLWNERKGVFKLETHLREDAAEVAESFREWGRGETEEFPTNIDNSLPTFHQTKTVLAIELHPRIDRVWYVEAPTIIRLRPTTRREQLETERKYWESRNDEPRRLLVEEKILRIDKPMVAQEESTDMSPKTEQENVAGTDSHIRE